MEKLVIGQKERQTTKTKNHNTMCYVLFPKELPLALKIASPPLSFPKQKTGPLCPDTKVERLTPEHSLLSWLWSPAHSRLPSYPCLGLFCIPSSKKGSQAEYGNLGQRLMEKYVRLNPHCHPGRWEELQAMRSPHVSASLHPASLVKAVHLGANVCQKDHWLMTCL